MTLGEKIYKLRTQKNLSQGDLADALKVSRQSISKWETNSSVPELDKLVKLSKLFEVTLDELVLNKLSEEAPTEPEPKVIYVENKRIISTKKVIGIILLCFAAVVWVMVALFGDLAAGLVLALPFVTCGLICLFSRENTLLWCSWCVYLLAELYLRLASGVNWHYIFIPQVYDGGHTVSLIVAWGLWVVYLLLTIITVIRFRKVSSDAARSMLTVALISWAVYCLSRFISIPPYTGNNYDISSMMLYLLVTSVTGWVRNIVLVVAVVFTARLGILLWKKIRSR